MRRICTRLISTGAAQPDWKPLLHRSALVVRGPDAPKLIQSLTTNNVEDLNDDQIAQSTCFLNSRGRVLHDALLVKVPSSALPSSSNEPSFVLDCDTRIVPDLRTHLIRYKLRSKVEIEQGRANIFWKPPVSNSQLLSTQIPLASPSSFAPPADSSVSCLDPRWFGMGHRLYSFEPNIAPQPSSSEYIQEYLLHRLLQAIPEGVDDFPVGDSLPLECNIDLLNGVSFSKGCYVGQELTARTHHVGMIRKRLMPIVLLPFAEAEAFFQKGDLSQESLIQASQGSSRTISVPSPGTAITVEGQDGTSRNVGRLGSTFSPQISVGLAVLRLSDVFGVEEAVGNEELGGQQWANGVVMRCGEWRVLAWKPAYFDLLNPQ